MPRAITESEKRSKEVLYKFLTEAQKRSLQRNGWFKVVGSDGFTYEVGFVQGRSMSSYVRARRRWLGYPENYLHRIDTILDARPIRTTTYRDRWGDRRTEWHDLPVYDQMLHQMLALQADAPKFIKTACKS